MSLILSYELADSPNYEYEVEVSSLAEAKRKMASLPTHMIVWASLTDEQGNDIDEDLY